MLDIDANLVLFRGFERLLIVLGGFFFAYLGYRLFLYGVDEGNGKLETESPFFKLTFSGSGPGLFFMAFGALVLINAIFAQVETRQEAVLNGASNDQTITAAAADGVQSFKSEMKFGADSKGVCDKIRYRQNASNINYTLEAYETETSASATHEEFKALAASLRALDLGDENKEELLLNIDALICKMEYQSK